MGNFVMESDEDFERAKREAEAFYAKIGSVYCPYFSERITFNAKGIRHLKFGPDQQARPRKDQYPRFKLIRLAPEVLRLSRTIQGIWRMRQWNQAPKEVIFYEFIAIIDGVRIKVIAKEMLGGEKYFWSVIPFWKTDRIGRRVLYSGNPESD